MKRFYTRAQACKTDKGWSVQLDGRAVKTPGKRALVLPTQALAEALAHEWAAQGTHVQLETLPLTQYVCSAWDRVGPARRTVIDQASAYVDTDLLAYPAPNPPTLRAQQDAVWGPLLGRLHTLGWEVQQTSGLQAIDQPSGLGIRARAWLTGKDDLALTALASLIETSGSLLLTYLLAEDDLTIDDLIRACTLEERFALQTWGSDLEAEDLLAHREADLRSAAQLLNLL